MNTATLTPVSGSSLLAKDGWSDDSTVLTVQYHNGTVYEFRGLSPATRKAYEAAPSKGKYLKQFVETSIQGVKVG